MGLIQGLDKFKVSGDGGGSNIKSIQRGTFTMTATSNTITISSIDITKSVVMVTITGATSAAYDASSSTKGVLTNPTTLTLTRQDTTYGIVVTWVVVEFNNVKSLQTGIKYMSANTTVTISSVNVSKSLVFDSSDNNNTGVRSQIIDSRCDLINPTTLSFTVSSGVGYNHAWQVIEFN